MGTVIVTMLRMIGEAAREGNPALVALLTGESDEKRYWALVEAGRRIQVTNRPQTKRLLTVALAEAGYTVKDAIAYYDAEADALTEDDEQPVSKPAKASKPAASAVMTPQENAIVRLIAKERGITSTTDKAQYSALRREVRALR